MGIQGVVVAYAPPPPNGSGVEVRGTVRIGSTERERIERERKKEKEREREKKREGGVNVKAIQICPPPSVLSEACTSLNPKLSSIAA